MKPSDSEIEGHRAQVARYCAEESLLWFTRYFFRSRVGVTFTVNWHHVVLCEALEAVYRGDVRNLLINVPTGSSKTEVAVISFMAWCIAKNPLCRFLHVSYAQSLVALNSSTTKELIESPEYQALWKREIRKDSKARDRWNVEVNGRKAGGCYAAPLGGRVTGFRAGHMASGFNGAIIIDDPLKPEDAFSEARRSTANRQLANTVRSRKAVPETPVILIMQRIHTDDPTQFALDGKIGGLEFDRHIVVPALDAKDQSYWEFKESTADLLAWRDSDPYTFASQMQQNPTVLGGSIFRAEWWKFWEPDSLPAITSVRIYADTALKTAERHDFSVFQAWGLGEDRNLYLLDQIRGKWEAPDLEEQAIRFWNKWRRRPLGDGVAVPSVLRPEDKASGTGLIQSLKRKGIPVDGIKRSVDKVSRANDIAPSVKAGLVRLPKDAPFLVEYLAEFEAFSPAMTHRHDDQIDPTIDAVVDMILGGVGFYSGAL